MPFYNSIFMEINSAITLPVINIFQNGLSFYDETATPFTINRAGKGLDTSII